MLNESIRYFRGPFSPVKCLSFDGSKYDNVFGENVCLSHNELWLLADATYICQNSLFRACEKVV